MTQVSKSNGELSVVRVLVQASDCQDSGIGIVIARRPLMLLVPNHVIELVEQDRSLTILVNGIPREVDKILPMPALQRDHLSVLQFRKKSLRDLKSAQLPRKSIHLHPGQSISMQRLSSEPSSCGKIVEVVERGDGSSVITDIAVATGDSGSPVLVSDQLVAVCQGIIQREGRGTAVCVPLSDSGLSELRKLRLRYRVNLLTILMGTLLAMAAFVGGFAVYSSNTFALASIEVSEDGEVILARNANTLTVNPVWSRSFETPIRRSLAFSSETGSEVNRVAVGTIYEDGINGVIKLLDSRGTTLWSYSVPDGECIYSTPELAYDGYLVDVITVADLNEDGLNELLVAFVHNHFAPCRFLVFDLSGTILAEYWHAGYIRTIATGRVGEASEMMVILSASNNALTTGSWNPQTIFAFRGLDIAGHSPPYNYLGAAERTDLLHGTEAWYQVIVNVDPEFKRAKCRSINIDDFDGDGVAEIQFSLSDGRFYYVDETGEQFHVEIGDSFRRDFPDADPPPLVEIWEYHTASDVNE